MQQPKLRTLLIVLVGIVVLGIVWFFALMISRSGKQPIDIIVSPADAKITINGNGVNSGTVYVSKGKHTVKATRQHFADVTKEIDTTNLQEDNKVYLVLQSTDAEGDKYIQTHEEEGAIRG
ncbi:MAG TPA: PEGA domain-containing protein, partial [Candidatus Saccharimonadales bacterium]|nr:PEGA domain-containing protein [Candidatus Saccharimonadales bacterium]